MRAAHSPRIIRNQSDLLWSINDRLGALCARLRCEPAGCDVDPLDDFYLEEILVLAEARALKIQEAVEEARRGR
jgi:hypothetical protein